jgi:hypothetical protein
MTELLKIYNKKEKVSITSTYQLGNFKVTQLATAERKVGLIIHRDKNLNKPVFLLPGAECGEKKAPFFIHKLRFILLAGFPIILYYQPEKLPVNDREFFAFFHSAIAEIRGIIDTVAQTYHPESFSLIGISIGGMLGIIATAVEPKIKKGIFITAAGNLENITWRGLMRFKFKKDCSRNVCHRMHKVYKKLLKGKLYDELLNMPRKCFIYDPMTFACFLKDKKILMLSGIFDMVIPFFSVIDTKKQMKKVKILWYPGTHLMFFLFLPFFKKTIRKFLAK